MLRLVNVPEKERIVSLRGLALLLGCLLVLLSPPATAQVSDGMRDGEEYAPVVLDGVELFRVRGMIVAPAEERAEDIVARIEAEAADPAVQPSAITARELDFGTGIFSGERLMFRIVDADAELEQVSRGWLAEMITERVRTAIIQYRAERGSTHLLRGLGLALAATLAMGVLTLLVQGSCRRLQRLITSKSDALHGIVEQRSFHVLTPKSLLALLLGLVGFVRWIILALALYAYLAFTLVLFPWTRRLADDALELFVDPIHTVGLAILGYLPKFVFLVIIILIARFVLRGARLFFQAIETRRITLGGFDHDWAMPTFRIVRVGIIVFTIVMAYPYVPGAGSAALQGMSIFLGLILSLGSSSIIANVIAGYSMYYRRTFRVGDYVQVAGQVGEVVDVRLLVTHVRTAKNENVAIPNSLILGTEVINYSVYARDRGLIVSARVGIGYDVAWQEVERLLLEAASRVPGALKQPAPFVLECGLGDFAVAYEINIYSRQANDMPHLTADLQRHILDVFNESGVPIMTPAYIADPPEPKLAPVQGRAAPPEGLAPA